MRPGEEFEKECYGYLEKEYRTANTHFFHKGGMDSTKSDIAVFKNGKLDFYIEAKDSSAQSGQFVLLPNADTETFTFSPRNKSQPNQMTDIIIEYINSDFHRFNNAGTAGESIDIQTDVFSNWIIQHYQKKNVKYVISRGLDYVIFPIRKYQKYFNITANFRTKKSGSRTPSQKDIAIIKQCITSRYPSSSFTQVQKKLYVTIAAPLATDKFILGKYTYYLSKQSHNEYEVRKLSNTYNMNVIFSVNLIKDQDPNDLREFKADL